MQVSRMNGELYKSLVINGAVNLKNSFAEIDALNVFPVPDGDTGTNMKMTMMSGVNEITHLDEDSIFEISKRLSRGLLMGARGNSGVILSQLFRGMSKGFEGVNEANALELAYAFKKGVEQAYKAVMKPVEGTILTVAREAADKAYESCEENEKLTINECIDIYLTEAYASLERTPDLLPVLKEAGVIDSGGAGYIKVIEGMKLALEGKMLSEEVAGESLHVTSKLTANLSAKEEHSDFGYCTEFIIQMHDGSNEVEDLLKGQLSQLGDSIVVVQDEDIVKVHVHTNTPGDAMNLVQVHGNFVNIKIENMDVQHSELGFEDDHDHDHHHEHKELKPRTKYAVIAVAKGKGLINLFKELGVNYIIEGGQTMNPSTEQFLDAIHEVNADNILIFPNNKNIMLVAEQAAEICEHSNVLVVPAKTIAQGYAALTMMDLNGDAEDIVEELKEVISEVSTGEVTYSIRSTEIEGVKIAEGDYMGIANGKIVVAQPNRIETTKKLIEAIAEEEKEIITVIYGVDVEENELEEISSFIEENFEDLEFEAIDGGQDVYSYIIAVE